MRTRREILGGLGVCALAAGLSRVVRAEDPPLLVVFTSDRSARTSALIRGLKTGLAGATLMSCDLSTEADAGAFIADNLRGVDVALVAAVGGLALRVALREFAATPVIWADTLDDAAAALHPKARGVSPRLDPAAVLAKLKTLKPDLGGIGVLRSIGDNDVYWSDLEAACKSAGLDLRSPPLAGPAEVDNAFKQLSSAAGITWIQPDPQLWTGAVLASLFHEAELAHHPIIGFQREQLSGAQHPAAVLESDPAAMGKLAAQLAISALKGALPEATRTYAPSLMVAQPSALRAAGILVNKKTAAAVDVWAD